ncbi:MAG TPA: methyltransferase [Streptosporangiaceae bacterium]|nr:methyltransferase [Streptosporangiaceae bacterium]
MSASAPVRDQSAAFALLDLIQGSVITQALYAAAQLGIADILSDGALSPGDIATKVSADPEAIYRVLRMLSGYGVFAERGDGRYELTPMADALRADAPDSMRGIALLMGHPMFWEDWGHLLESVRTGEASLPGHRGMSAYEYLGSNPEFAGTFFQGMGSMSAPETDTVIAAHDFSARKTIIDVGGGRGGLLAGILNRASGSRGVLYDAPHNSVGADAVLEAAGVADRASIEHGSYFETVPAGGDAYILKHTLHDFSEAQILAVLKNIRDAIKPDGAVYVIEYVLPGQNNRHIGNIIDLWLMMLLGAKERTADQYAELLAGAGFKLSKVIPTTSPVSIIEALPA